MNTIDTCEKVKTGRLPERDIKGKTTFFKVRQSTNTLYLIRLNLQQGRIQYVRHKRLNGNDHGCPYLVLFSFQSCCTLSLPPANLF